ncbi:MAG TPA: iron-sulfur cluster assembly protein, partial [Planctomycetota bacterium]|nr:iron-sulfur cluster assembly protein [Planctomycetota bacterium]
MIDPKNDIFPAPAPAQEGEPKPPERDPATYGQGEQNPALMEQVVATLKTIYDPEIPVNIYEMGMIYEVRADTEGSSYVRMTLTSPSCPVAGSLPGEVQDKVAKVEGVSEVKVELVWEPTWTMDKI